MKKELKSFYKQGDKLMKDAKKKTYNKKYACRNCSDVTIWKIPFGVKSGKFLLGKMCIKCGCTIDGTWTTKEEKEALRSSDELIKEIEKKVKI